MAAVPVFGGTAALCDFLDLRMLVILRDGRHLQGTLRSYDQFCNLVLEHASERHFAQGKYCDISLGLHIIRGENIVLVGEIDEEVEAKQTVLVEAPMAEVMALEEEDAEVARRQQVPTQKESWSMEMDL